MKILMIDMKGIRSIFNGRDLISNLLCVKLGLRIVTRKILIRKPIRLINNILL